ncbi:MAG: tyrosine-type recombinase/integrase [Hespellia sp.]|nr:tyrosine-type recombinase/integrase [Hespellia sp.]
MAKRKKYPKLPNGYGSIKYLGKGRRNPYAVHPPTTEFTLDGIPVIPKAICYVDDWMKGFAVLTAYHAGTYTPELLQELSELPNSGDTAIIQRILTDYSSMKGITPGASEKTFREVYEDFYQYKFERDKSKSYSKASRYSIQAAYKNCTELHDRPFRSLRHDDLQKVVDCCPLGHGSLELIVTLLNQMYAYADIYDLCDKDYSKHVKINIPDDTEHGKAFTEKELKTLWQHQDNKIIEFLLIMCYSGYRISAYKTLEIHLKERYFLGGVKTASGKNRIVPIHSAILPLVKRRIRQNGTILVESTGTFRKDMYITLETIGIKHHTPHDCRHTFSALCEKYEVNENDRKRMLGHSFGEDITNKVYGHREIEDLRREIEKIKVCY